ncbi:hypothetical protein [Nocardia asiatica]|uniref:hypothetical protein n=1 Tax=Nocardia asiatica TaxID=209252 RepID=UPI003EE311E1
MSGESALAGHSETRHGPGRAVEPLVADRPVPAPRRRRGGAHRNNYYVDFLALCGSCRGNVP